MPTLRILPTLTAQRPSAAGVIQATTSQGNAGEFRCQRPDVNLPELNPLR